MVRQFMRKRLLIAALILCLAFMAGAPAMANSGVGASDSGVWTEAEIAALMADLEAAIGEADERPQLQQFLEGVSAEAEAVMASSDISDEDGLAVKGALQYAVKLANDAKAKPDLWADTPFIVYEVPALSAEKRLPYTLPKDGRISETVSVISAQDEYEAASFIMVPLSDADSVTFTVNDLQGDNGVIPSTAVDMHVVKTWYQGGTAWQSYFFDDTLDVLVPELLLHDENLILVDHEQKKNYLRVDYPEGSQYIDVFTKPAKKFDHWAEPVADSEVLLPIELKQGESKQMWITTKVPAGTPEGIYTGTIDITADGAPAGQLELKILVLPFELPAPKTYYNLDKDFYVLLFHESRVWEYMTWTGGNAALVDEKLLNTYRNMAEHNAVNIPAPGYVSSRADHFLHQLDLMEQAGLDLDPLFGAGAAFAPYQHFNDYNNYMTAKAAYEADPTEAKRVVMETHYNNWRTGIENHKQHIWEAYHAISNHLGHTNMYFDGWDEAGWSLLQWQQEMWQFVKEEVGAKLFATGHASHMDLEIKEDFLNWVGEPTRERADAWHAFGEDKMITNYAYPHTGPENPDLMRQRHGMWMYKANYDAVYNYIYYENFLNVWNDEIDATFRQFNLVYPTLTDVIDTIAWEGFREGIDDIRYATKLKQLAEEALASGQADRIAAANKALTWLEATDERKVNADYLRLEMINHILTLLELA